MIEHDITQLLQAHESGDHAALDTLYTAVYQELRRIAQRQVAKSWSVETLCTTALINESYLKLLGSNQTSFENRSHFFAIAATAMRQVILNYADRKASQKRGGDWRRVTLEQTLAADQHSADTLSRVSDAIDEVDAIDSDLARLIEMRFFAGMSESEIGSVNGVSERTVRRNWQKAKALLTQALRE